MVKRVLLAAAVLAAASLDALADGRCTRGSETEPPLCPLSIASVQRVTITENGAKSTLESDPSVKCSGFVVTEGLVRRFLRQAKRVPDGAGHSTLDWSPCYAAGTVRFKDGLQARWSMTQLRVGSLTFDGQAEQTLYCATCRTKPFIW